ncbi:hypothetical protein RHMOL_Rhmol04G0202400 [Rhododendron molle]|uniref:Uncharacterized protein n=1 Tax=Rhododendron molle TaxID=49168 RepID=A0ACC0P2R6_RHOML|nr:hypothetical protein RHMOL_Rhmol04G0202400 [Rhododendron molle]
MSLPRLSVLRLSLSCVCISLSRLFSLSLIMDDMDIPGGDQPLRVEVTSLPVALERDTMAGEVPETSRVLAQAVMAMEAMASAVK